MKFRKKVVFTFLFSDIRLNQLIIHLQNSSSPTIGKNLPSVAGTRASVATLARSRENEIRDLVYNDLNLLLYHQEKMSIIVVQVISKTKIKYSMWCDFYIFTSFGGKHGLLSHL